ncbi:hypothetical protein Trydic_g17909 [Trypoxylus dichotomus]
MAMGKRISSRQTLMASNSYIQCKQDNSKSAAIKLICKQLALGDATTWSIPKETEFTGTIALSHFRDKCKWTEGAVAVPLACGPASAVRRAISDLRSSFLANFMDCRDDGSAFYGVRSLSSIVFCPRVADSGNRFAHAGYPQGDTYQRYTKLASPEGV